MASREELLNLIAHVRRDHGQNTGELDQLAAKVEEQNRACRRQEEVIRLFQIVVRLAQKHDVRLDDIAPNSIELLKEWGYL